MDPEKRRPQPCGDCGASEKVLAGSFDVQRNNLQAHKKQASHRAEFAREATIAAFGWHHARALDQADFIDRKPGLVPFGKIAGRVIERLAEAVEVRDGCL